MKKRFILLIMYICSFICSLAPLVSYIIINSERYIGLHRDEEIEISSRLLMTLN